MKQPSMQIGLGIVLGIGSGAGVAFILGSGGLWLAIGIAIGVAVGVTMSRNSSHKANDQRLTSNE
jgi:hypothetical protein